MSEPPFLPLTTEQRAEQERCYRSSGVLTPEILNRALDELWNPPVPPPVPGYSGRRQPFGLVPVEEHDPEWTVTAGGYRLVIRDGAMVGLEPAT